MSAKPCRGCGRPVVFGKDFDGKWQVLDNVSPTWEQIGVKDGVAIVARSKAMVSHFSTCPAADQFSARKPKGEAPWPTERHFSEPKETA